MFLKSDLNVPGPAPGPLPRPHEAVPDGACPLSDSRIGMSDLRRGVQVLVPISRAPVRGVRGRRPRAADEGPGQGVPPPSGHPREAGRHDREGKAQPRDGQVRMRLMYIGLLWPACNMCF